jgi:hypothetical protein
MAATLQRLTGLLERLAKATREVLAPSLGIMEALAAGAGVPVLLA